MRPAQDVRIPGAEWPEVKHTTPFGQVPVLVVDGVMVAQTPAICASRSPCFNTALNIHTT
jgi:hypothetical protein